MYVIGAKSLCMPGNNRTKNIKIHPDKYYKQKFTNTLAAAKKEIHFCCDQCNHCICISCTQTFE